MKYLNIKLFIFALIFLSFYIFQGCHSIAPCINDDMKQIKIMWGDYDEQNKIYKGYKLYPDGLLQEYYRDSSKVDVNNNIAYISSDEVCQVLKYYYWAMKKVQTCYEPGNNLKYMTLINDKYNTYWNVVWNDDFNTGSNKYLKIVYDSLNSIINKIKK